MNPKTHWVSRRPYSKAINGITRRNVCWSLIKSPVKLHWRNCIITSRWKRHGRRIRTRPVYWANRHRHRHPLRHWQRLRWMRTASVAVWQLVAASAAAAAAVAVATIVRDQCWKIVRNELCRRRRCRPVCEGTRLAALCNAIRPSKDHHPIRIIGVRSRRQRKCLVLLVTKATI